MSQSFHMCVDVRGVLELSPKEFHRKWHDVFSDKDGRILTDSEARDELFDELAKGHRVIPCGDCDNFDFDKGCLGHDHPDTKGEEAEK